MGTEIDFLGKGIYSISDASFLIHTNRKTINNWVRGYQNKTTEAQPVIDIDYQPIDSFYSISFLDLVELYFVDAFRRHGVSLHTIRKVYNKAKNTIGFTHPFSTKRFKTDGRSILEQIDDERLLDILKDQFEIKQILDPFLVDAFDFRNDIVNRLWPLGKDRQVVIDPDRCFGKPIIDNGSVSVEVLFNAYKAEQSIEKVASWFEVDNVSVNDAVEYYQNLAA